MNAITKVEFSERAMEYVVRVKQFLGPLICVAFGWLAFRWTAGLITVAKQWPWIDCSWGGCSLPPPPQNYVIAAAVVLIGICVYFMLGSLLFMGWRWFLTPVVARVPRAGLPSR